MHLRIPEGFRGGSQDGKRKAARTLRLFIISIGRSKGYAIPREKGELSVPSVYGPGKSKSRRTHSARRSYWGQIGCLNRRRDGYTLIIRCAVHRSTGMRSVRQARRQRGRVIGRLKRIDGRTHSTDREMQANQYGTDERTANPFLPVLR